MIFQKKPILFSCILFIYHFATSQLNLDSIEKILPTKKGAEKVKLMSDLCWEYGASNPKKAEKFGKLAVDLAKKIQNDTLLALAYNDLGTLSLRLGDYPTAKEKYALSITIRKKINDNIGIASIYSKLAVIEEIQGNYSQSLAINLKVLKIYEKEGLDQVAIATLYGNISVILYNMNHLDRAYEYNNKGFIIGKKIKNNQVIATAYGNFGSIFSKKRQHLKAIEYYKFAISNFVKINNQSAIASCYNNIGNSFGNMFQLDSSLYYYKKSLGIRKEIGDRNGILSITANLASINNKLNRPDLAIKYGLEGLKESFELNTKDETKNLYDHLTKSYFLKKDFERAYHYQKKYIDLKDSIFNQETTKQIAEMSTKYETEKKENQILLLKKDKEVQKTEAKRQRTISITFVIGFIIVLIFTFFIINRLLIIRKQKVLIEKQKHLVEEKNREITDSITYAKRIQSAILPQHKLIKESLQNSFILYKPKDIVAGDFYWMEPTKNGVIFAAADCTGHGVPGAMVSVVCHNALNRSVREFGLTDPSKILDKTREIVISEFEKSDSDVKDGMDISLCYLNLKTNEMLWAGANNPLWILRKNDAGKVEVLETKPDKQPIGKYLQQKPFTTHQIELQKNDCIYIFTDGYQDQFGGPENKIGGKKMKITPMKDMFISIFDRSMDEQLTIVDAKFENWKGKFEQVDDVCVIGVKI